MFFFQNIEPENQQIQPSKVMALIFHNPKQGGVPKNGFIRNVKKSSFFLAELGDVIKKVNLVYRLVMKNV